MLREDDFLQGFLDLYNRISATTALLIICICLWPISVFAVFLCRLSADMKTRFVHFVPRDWRLLVSDCQNPSLRHWEEWPGSNIKRFVSKFMETFKTILQCYLIQINISGQFITIRGVTIHNNTISLYSFTSFSLHMEQFNSFHGL